MGKTTKRKPMSVKKKKSVKNLSDNEVENALNNRYLLDRGCLLKTSS